MEVLIIIGIVVFCIVVGSLQNSPKAGSAAASGSSRLQIRCQKKSETLPGLPFPLEVLVFEVNQLCVPGGSGGPSLTVELSDRTDGSSLPVHCAISDLQAPGTLAFRAHQQLDPIPYGSILNVTSFTQICAVPRELLEFPRSGTRRIVATLTVSVPGKPQQTASANFSVDSPGDGYLESVEKRQRSEELGVYLAMHLAAADDRVDKIEADVVKSWIETQLHRVPPDQRDLRRDRFNAILSDAFEKVNKPHTALDIESIAREMEEKTSLPMKYEMIELCMDVMKADGVADPGELRQLKRIATLIGLDDARYSALLDKRLAEVETLHSGPGDDLAALVGIAPAMSKAEIKSHLNKEFRKWNARVSNSDPDIRARALKMVEHIAEARSKYL